MAEELAERQAAEARAFEEQAAKALAALPVKKTAQRRALQRNLERERELMKQRHAQERLVLSGEGAAASQLSPVQDLPEERSSTAQGDGSAPSAFYSERKLSRKQLKKLAKQEKEYDKELERELDRSQEEETARERELAQIQLILQSRTLCIDQVEPDGHCLFRAIVRQLRPIIFSNRFDECFPGANAETRSRLITWRLEQDELEQVWSLRAAVASFIRHRASDFLPFLSCDGDWDLDDGNVEVGNDANARLWQYCEKLEHTALWGGQPELYAIALALACRVEVYGDPAVLPNGVLVMDGDANPSEDKNWVSTVLRVSFHRQFFALGEHYHAVVQDHGTVTQAEDPWEQG